MPPRKTKNYKRKKPAKSKKVQDVRLVPSNYRTLANRMNRIFPKTFRTKLRMSDILKQTETTAGTPVFAHYRANSLYDCTLGSFDYARSTLSFLANPSAPVVLGFYENFTVHSSTITVYANNPNGTATGIVGLFKKNLVQLAGTLQGDDVYEERNSSWAICTSPKVGNPIPVLTQTINVGKWLGQKNPLDEVTNRGGYNTVPAAEIYHMISWQSQLQTEVIGDCIFTVIIDYDVTFTVPITPDK